MAAALTTIFDYMREFAPELGERIVEAYPPLQAPGAPLSPLLAQLKRKPLPAQALAIQGTVEYLRDHRAAKIVAECGTGKTLMSLATCYVHAAGKPFTSITMVPPHITKKWAREVLQTLPDTRVFLIDDMRNGGDRKKPHGVSEVALVRGASGSYKIERRGFQCSLAELKRLGRNGWRKRVPGNSFFIMSREKGKLNYFWRHAYTGAGHGKSIGSIVSMDTGRPVERSTGGQLATIDFADRKLSEQVKRPAKGSAVYSAFWQADRSKIQRVAPLEYMGRYLKGWFDYAIADELHQLSNDTAQGNGLAVLARASRRLIGLTGTLIGGYADDLFNIFYRMDGPAMVRSGYGWGSEGRKLFQSTYGVVEEVRTRRESDNACSKASKDNVTIKRRPGCSPLLFGRYLMENTAFVSLEDIAENLPEYTESVVPVDADTELQAAYDRVEQDFTDALRRYPRNPSIISLMAQTLLCYPDHPFDFGTLTAKVPDGHGGFMSIVVSEPPNLPQELTFAKERDLLTEIRGELAEGRRVQVFATFTGKHDVCARLQHVLEREGLRVAVLRATVATDAREQWYEDRLAEGVQVVVCHPRLVETGLDLLAFPTILFYETGYSLHTLRQASRRSWRIGQKHKVRVKFLFYGGTLQEKCVKLMGRRMLVALMMEGKMSGEGLDGFEEDDDMMRSMVRELLEKGGVGESADAIWRNLERERAIHTPAHTELAEMLEQVAHIAPETSSTGVVLPTLESVRPNARYGSGLLDFGTVESAESEARKLPLPFPAARKPVRPELGQMLLFA